MIMESYVTVTNGKTTGFIGPDAVMLFQTIALRHAIDFYINHKMRVNRAYTVSAMLDAASRTTGNTYKRTQLAKASLDLQKWIHAMKAAIPIVEK